MIINHVESLTHNSNNPNSENQNNTGLEDEDDNPAARIPKSFNLILSETSKGKEESTYFQDGTYFIRSVDINLKGDQILPPESSWRLQFLTHERFGCCGFGLISLDDPNNNSQWRGIGKHPLFCGCCNGSWGSGSMSQANSSESNTILFFAIMIMKKL